MVKVKRHIAKTVSYRILSSLFGFFIMWYITGDVRVGGMFSMVEIIIKPIIYFTHERIWYRFIRYGLKDKLKM
jgi:uncharacterized membrane protein